MWTWWTCMAIILSQLTISTGQYAPTAIQGHPDSNLYQSAHVTASLPLTQKWQQYAELNISPVHASGQTVQLSTENMSQTSASLPTVHVTALTLCSTSPFTSSGITITFHGNIAGLSTAVALLNMMEFGSPCQFIQQCFQQPRLHNIRNRAISE